MIQEIQRSLQGGRALVTGASRGIGRAVAVALAAEGVSVALTARNKDGLQETKDLCEQSGVKAVALACDVANPSEIETCVKEARAALGGLDILINNAGTSHRASSAEVDLEKWDRVLDINLKAPIHFTRHALESIGESGWGAVINIASLSGKHSYKGGGIYNATKHGVVGFTGALFEDVREKNIKVCDICPGFVNTDMVASYGHDLSKMIQPDDIAQTVLFVLQFPDTGCPTEILVRPQKISVQNLEQDPRDTRGHEGCKIATDESTHTD